MDIVTICSRRNSVKELRKRDTRIGHLFLNVFDSLNCRQSMTHLLKVSIILGNSFIGLETLLWLGHTFTKLGELRVLRPTEGHESVLGINLETPSQ